MPRVRSEKTRRLEPYARFATFPAAHDDDLASTKKRRKHPRPCGYCDRQFNSSGDLSRHVLIHQDAKPFACGWIHKTDDPKGKYKMGDACRSEFRQKTALLIHMNIHTGATPYFCNRGCEKKFSDPSSCSRHRKEVHGEAVTYRCWMCTTSIKRKDAFITHCLKQHPEYKLSKADVVARMRTEPKDVRGGFPWPIPVVPSAKKVKIPTQDSSPRFSIDSSPQSLGIRYTAGAKLAPLPSSQVLSPKGPGKYLEPIADDSHLVVWSGSSDGSRDPSPFEDGWQGLPSLVYQSAYDALGSWKGQYNDSAIMPIARSQKYDGRLLDAGLYSGYLGQQELVRSGWTLPSFPTVVPNYGLPSAGAYMGSYTVGSRDFSPSPLSHRAYNSHYNYSSAIVA